MGYHMKNVIVLLVRFVFYVLEYTVTILYFITTISFSLNDIVPEFHHNANDRISNVPK